MRSLFSLSPLFLVIKCPWISNEDLLQFLLPGFTKQEEKVRWLSEHRGHLYSSMPPAHSILLKDDKWDKILWGPTATRSVSFSRTEPLTKLPSQVPPRGQLCIFEEASQTSHNPCFVPTDSELPLVLSKSFVSSSQPPEAVHCNGHFLSLQHKTPCLINGFHSSVASWEPLPWVLPISTPEGNALATFPRGK